MEEPIRKTHRPRAVYPFNNVLRIGIRSLPRNRLRLDFSLQTAEERLDFLNSYLPTITFEPDEHEQETLSDYLLWGKNKDGLNAQQEGDVSIKEWNASKVDSIDGLMEMPGF